MSMKKNKKKTEILSILLTTIFLWLFLTVFIAYNIV